MPVLRNLFDHWLRLTIQSIVKRHSGGIEMLELVAEVAAASREKPDWKGSGVEISEIPRRIEAVVHELSDHHVLEYEWDMGDGTLRSKQFVYFKREGK